MNKTKTIKLAIALTLILSIANAFAGKKHGGDSGGGGEPEEIRFDEIRSDILKWIKSGGAKALTLPEDISFEKYEKDMSEILQPKVVIVSFTEDKVYVNGVEKTCRGYITPGDEQANIICNISRFTKTSESQQYKLVHHEFAGLVNIERNDGAASDYVISTQLTSFLKSEKVLKLSIKMRSEHGNYVPSKIFGQYPARFNCYKEYGRELCNVPSVEEVEDVIEAYKADLPARQQLINEFLTQNDERISKLNKIADEVEKEIGPNKFSKVYRENILHLKERVSSLSPSSNASEFQKIFGNNSPYVKLLEKLKNLVATDSSIESFISFINNKEFSGVIQGYNDASVRIKYRQVHTDHRFDKYLNYEESCSSVQGKGQYATTSIWLTFMQTELDPKDGFDLTNEQDIKILKEILISNNNEAINVECVKMNRNAHIYTEMIPTYNSAKKKLTIPYKVFQGLKPNDGKLEYVVDLYYFQQEHYLEMFRKLIK